MLRYGVIAGLAITLLGVLIKQTLGINDVVTLGSLIIVSAPPASLISVGIRQALRKDFKGLLLSQLTVAVIIASIILSLHHVW